MFDPAYGWIYAGVVLLAVTGTALALSLYVHQLRQHRKLLGRRAAVPPLPQLPDVPAQRQPE
jgi:hypothetical protein